MTHALAVPLLLLFLAAPAVPAESAGSKPNVLFIIADDLGTRLGCYGDPMAGTPHIDRLAERGVRFTQAFCQLPTCGPSRASMLTGLYPWDTGITSNRHRLRDVLPKVVTLPQLLRENGYFTARVGKIYHMGIPLGIGTAGDDDPLSWSMTINNTGWDRKDENLARVNRTGGRRGLGVALGWLAAPVADHEMADSVGTTEAIRIMDQRHPAKTGKPLMLAVGYYRPHPPMIAPKKYFDLYPLDLIHLPVVPANDRDDIPECAFELKEEFFNFVSEETGRRYTQARYASTSFIDAQVGLLLDAIEERGLQDNTIVVFVGDQGFHLGEHGHWHKTTLFEEGLHVPLIIVTPAARMAGRSADLPVELADIYPTLCGLTGLEMPHESDARSLVPQLEDATRPGRSAAVSMVRHPDSFSIRTARYRYTEWNGGKDGVELYDHETDPQEHSNLAKDPAHAVTVARLRAMLRQRVD